MKIVLAILCVAVINQVPLAGAKNEDESYDFEKDFSNYLAKCKNVLEQADIIIKAVLKDMPATKEYSEHKKTLETYLENYEGLKDTFDDCFANLYKTGQSYAKLYEQYEEDDVSASAKEVRQLLDKHGIKELQYDTDEYMKSPERNKLEEVMNSWTAEYKQALITKCNTPIVKP